MTEEQAYRKMISTVIGCYNTTRPAHVSSVDHVASKSVVRADAELYAISRYGKPIPAARFTREDVEKVARAICQVKTGNPDCLYQHNEWEKWPVDNRHEYKDAFTGEARVTLSHFAWRHWADAATAALSAIGEVEHG